MYNCINIYNMDHHASYIPGALLVVLFHQLTRVHPSPGASARTGGRARSVASERSPERAVDPGSCQVQAVRDWRWLDWFEVCWPGRTIGEWGLDFFTMCIMFHPCFMYVSIFRHRYTDSTYSSWQFTLAEPVLGLGFPNNQFELVGRCESRHFCVLMSEWRSVSQWNQTVFGESIQSIPMFYVT